MTLRWRRWAAIVGVLIVAAVPARSAAGPSDPGDGTTGATPSLKFPIQQEDACYSRSDYPPYSELDPLANITTLETLDEEPAPPPTCVDSGGPGFGERVTLMAHIDEEAWQIRAQARKCVVVPNSGRGVTMPTIGETAALVERRDGSRVWVVLSSPFHCDLRRWFKALATTARVSITDLLPSDLLGSGQPDLVISGSFDECDVLLQIENAGSGAAILPAEAWVTARARDRARSSPSVVRFDVLVLPPRHITTALYSPRDFDPLDVTLEVDPEDRIAELDETNNEDRIEGSFECVPVAQT